MRKFIFSLVFLIWTIGCFAQTPNQPALSKKDRQQSDLERSVKEAFAAAKPRQVRGAEIRDVTLVFELPRTAEIIPLLKPYLDDGDSSERSYVISLLDKIISPESIGLLVRGLTDSENLTAERAAGSLFKNYDREVLLNVPDLKNAVHNSVPNGNHSVPAYLLLGYFPGADAEKLLDAACRHWAKGKIDETPDRSEIQKSLVACVVLFGFGNPKSDYLLEKLRTEFNRSYFFLLNNLELIDAPDALNRLFQKAVTDSSLLYPRIDGPPTPREKTAPRILDLVINKFAERLNIDVGFPLKAEKRYSKIQVTDASRKILAEINRLKSGG